MKKFLAILLALGMIAGLLAGCGSAASAVESAAEQAAETVASAAEDAAEAVADALPGEGKHFVIATDTVFRPFEFTDESGAFVGIDVDILAAIAEDQGFTYDLNSLGWDSAIAACQAGQADGMIAGASITDERKENGWIFSDGYYQATQCMAVAADSDIAGFDGLSGQTGRHISAPAPARAETATDSSRVPPASHNSVEGAGNR